MSKKLIIALVFSLVIIGLVVNVLEYRIEDGIERAIFAGYPGTANVDVEASINWFKGGIKGNIESFKIDIENWRHKNWQINNFQGNFKNVKVNWWQLFQKRQFVVEKIQQGEIQLIVNENNLNEALGHYYQGLTAKLSENNIIIHIEINILGYDLTAAVQGHLIPGKGLSLYFVPDKMDIAKYQIPEGIRNELLQNFKIPLSLEKTPFTFQVTTVKIMQDKIIINGKV